MILARFKSLLFSPIGILWCGAVILSISLGVRHTFGLYLQPMSLEHGWGRETYSFAISLQNLCWGLAQPFVGRLADRLGPIKVMLTGTVLYSTGLLLMALSHTELALAGSAGLLIGLGLSGTTFPVVLGAVSKVTPLGNRSMAMGVCMAFGSLGQFVLLPGTSVLIDLLTWQGALIAFSVLAAAMIPLALPFTKTESLSQQLKAQNASEVSSQKASRHTPADGPDLQMGMMQSIRYALRQRDFALLSMGYFVCGFQLIFIGLHLPSYLADQGISAGVASTALALIGLFNIVGSWLAGYLGGRFKKPWVLSAIYALRAVAIVVFVSAPLSEWSVYLFAASMGVLWLSTVPLTTATVGTMFGVGNMAMLGGLVFMFHQIGSFMGGWLGGILFDTFGSYQLAWSVCAALGVMAALVNLPIKERSLVTSPPQPQTAT